MLSRLKSTYKGVGEIWRRYWSAYGGSKAFVASPYLHAAVVLTVVMHGAWSKGGWWDTVLAVVPSVLGFSLGGYAIWLAFGDARFTALLKGTATNRPKTGASSSEESVQSTYLRMNATFVHFIVVQIASIVVALFAKSQPLGSLPAPLKSWLSGTVPCVRSLDAVITYGGWFSGYLIFIYALGTAVAATMGIFRLASLYNRFQPKDETE